MTLRLSLSSCSRGIMRTFRDEAEALFKSWDEYGEATREVRLANRRRLQRELDLRVMERRAAMSRPRLPALRIEDLG